MSDDPRSRFKSVHQLRMALAHRSDNKFYIAIIVFLLAMIALLVWLTSAWAPHV
jgi:ABC-type multidrug transport system permease subunit